MWKEGETFRTTQPMDTNEVGVTDHQDLGVIMTCVGDLNLVDNNSTRDVWTHVNKDHKSSHKSLMVCLTLTSTSLWLLSMLGWS